MAERAPEPVAVRDALAVERPSLFGFATGSFHAAVLVAALVAGLHLGGTAGDLLEGFGTLPGALVYLYLWGVTVWTTDRALLVGGVSPAAGVPDRWRALGAALLGGGVTGVLFFAGQFVLVLGFFLLTGSTDALPFVLLIGLVGALVAALVGAVVGTVLATLDVALLWVAVVVTGDLSRPGA